MAFIGKLNIYRCDKCFGHIVTRDVDEGVTPFSLRCKATPLRDGMMLSSMYRVFDQAMAAGYEWYRPTAAEKLEPWVADHVARGGLLIRRAERSAEVGRAATAAAEGRP